MHFQTLSVILASALYASASALPPCRPGHAWPDRTDCHSFFECGAAHQPVRKTCGPGTAYCWETGVCVHEEKIPTCHDPHALGPKGPPSKGPGPQGPAPQGPAPHGPAPKGPAPKGPPSKGPNPKDEVPKEPASEGPKPRVGHL